MSCVVFCTYNVSTVQTAHVSDHSINQHLRLSACTRGDVFYFVFVFCFFYLFFIFLIKHHFTKWVAFSVFFVLFFCLCLTCLFTLGSHLLSLLFSSSFLPSDLSPTVKTSAEEDTRAAGRPRHHAS